MSVIMILAMVPSAAFAATSSPAPYDVWAYNIDTGKKTVLKMMLDDGKDKPTKTEVLEKLQNTLDDDGGYLVDDDVTEDELEIKFYNGDEGNIKKMLKGKGTEYKFNKAKLRLGYIAMTYEVVKPEHNGTVSFNVYLENDKETPAVTIDKDFKNNEAYEDVMPTANEIIDALAEKGIEPAAGHHFEVLTDWFGDGAWLYNKETGSAFDVSEKAENGTNLHTLVKDVANKVTISFDFDGGVINEYTEWDDLTKDAGYTLNLPYSTEIKKDGYTFLGWSANGSENYIEGGEYVLTEDTHFVAVWAEITHTVSFVAGTLSDDGVTPIDGVTYEDEIVADGKTVKTTAQEVEGYTFNDWYVEYDGTYINDPTKISGPIYKDETFYAVYDKVINNYTVSFDFNGGTYNDLTGWAPVQATEGAQVLLPNADGMKLDGYKFAGWDVLDANDKVIDTVDAAADRNYTVTEAVKFVAKWEQITFTVSFKAYDKIDKKFINADYDDEIVAVNEAITTTAKEISGYEFAGVWRVLNADGTVGDKFDVTTPITADITLVPVYSRIIVKHTVTFDANGGHLVTPKKEVKDGETVGKPIDPDKEHRNFIGWYVVDEQGNVADEKFDFHTPITEDITLKACYTISVEYNIYVDTFEGSEITAKDVVEIPEGDDIEDYLNAIFDGTVAATEFDKVYKWYSRPVWVANYTEDFDTRIAAFENGAPTVDFNDIDSVEYSNGTYRLFAMKVTDANAVTLTFENVLHGDKLEPMKITKDTPFGDVAVKNVKDGYQLEGWYNGTTKVDADTTFDADTTLKAKWNVLITFNTYKNGDFTTPEVTTEWVAVKINGGEGRFTTEAPTKGWYTKADWDKVAAGQDMTWDDIKPVGTTVTAPATYYGMETEKVNVSFSAGTGVKATGIPTITEAVYGSTLGDVLGDTAAPVRDKYQFVCWTVDGNKVDDTYVINADTEFVAEWEARDIVVNFELVNSNEGSDAVIEAIASQTIKYGEKAAKPTVTINSTDYRIDGWYADEACTEKVDFAEKTFTDDTTTLYAKVLTKVTLNVYTDANTLKPTVAEVFAPVNEALNTDALKTSYTNGGKVLYGWYTPENWANIQKGGDYTFENTDKVVDSFTVTEPVEFYGKVSEGYKVTFNAGEGVKAENMPDEQIVNYGKTATEPTEPPTRKGYTFEGWAFDFTSPIYHDTVITAKWTLNTYTITYDPNGGVFVDGANATRTISYGSEYGKLIDETQISRDGAKLIGWTTVKDDATTLVKAQDKYLVEDDTTLYALWEITGVTVTYVTNGGKVAELDDNVVTDSKGKDISNEKLPYGTKVNDVRKAVKDGLKFEGWYLDEGLTKAYDNAPLTGSITLYAKYYAEVTFQIYENDNYAAVIGTKTVNVDEFDTVELPTAKDLGVTLGANDEFFGWYTVDEFAKVQAGQTAVTVENVTATAEVTYCAKVLRHYTVTFNTNGGTDVDAQDVAYKGLATVPEEPTKVGHVFAGWYADETLTTEFDFTTPITADTTVYAKWDRAIVTITFNIVKDWMVGGGTNETVPINIYYGDVIPADAVPDTAVPGYTFNGWYLNGAAFDVATTPVTENITLDAAWHLNQFDAEIVGEYTYTGTGITPEIKVTDSTTKEAVDLTANPVNVTYEAVSENAKLDAAGLPVNAGTYKVTVSQEYAYPTYEGYKYVKAAPVELTLEVKPANISDAGRFNAVLENKDGQQTAYDPANLVKINFTGSEILLDGTDGTSEEGYKLYVYDTLRRSILDSTVPDFEIKYANNVNAGTATATVTGVGNYTGTLDVKFEIAKLQINIGPYLVIIEPSSYEYNGEAQQPNVTVKKDANSPALVYGKDFNVGYMPADDKTQLTEGVPVNVGTYKLVVEGIGNYEGTTNSEPDFTITPKSIKKVDVEFVKSWDYTGEEIKPEVKVKDGDKVLVEGVDYKVSYENNVNASEEAIVRIDGLGNYNDNRKIKFTIVPKSVNSADITALVEPTSVEYTGSAITVNLTVKDGEKVLVEGTDFGTEYVNNINVGTATIKVTGLNNYKDVKEVTFEITPVDITNYDAAIDPVSKIYNGVFDEPTLTVRKDDSTPALVKGTDYEVSYVLNGEEVEEPVNAGTYTVVIKGIGNYKGTVDAENLTYTIEQKEITADMVTVDTTEKESTGEAIKTTVTVKDGNKVLVEGTDYTVEYTNNVAPGTATVTVKGIGNYKGLVEKTFTITSKYYYVTGVVRYNSGRVIKFAKITLTGTDYLGNSVTRTTKTDKHGKYTFNNLKKGTYVVTYRNESKEALLNEQN